MESGPPNKQTASEKIDAAAEEKARILGKIAMFEGTSYDDIVNRFSGQPDRAILERQAEIDAHMQAHAAYVRNQAMAQELREQHARSEVARIHRLAHPEGLLETRERLGTSKDIAKDEAETKKDLGQLFEGVMLESRKKTLALANLLAGTIRNARQEATGGDLDTRSKYDPDVKAYVAIPNVRKRFSLHAFQVNGKLREERNEAKFHAIGGSEGWILNSPSILKGSLVLTENGGLFVGFGHLETEREGKRIVAHSTYEKLKKDKAEDLDKYKVGQRRLIVKQNTPGPSEDLTADKRKEMRSKGKRIPEKNTYYSFITDSNIDSDTDYSVKSHSADIETDAFLKREGQIREAMFELADSMGIEVDLSKIETDNPKAVEPEQPTQT